MATAKSNSPKTGFTPAFLDNLKKKTKRVEYRDTRAPGLRLRLEPTGRKTFVWYYKEGQKTKVLTIGRYGTGDACISLKQARAALEKAKARHSEGDSPAPPADTPKTVKELGELFYTRRILPHRKIPEAVRNVLDKDIYPVIGKKHIRTISTPAIATVVEAVVDRPAPVHAGKVLAILKQLFRFAAGRGYIDHSPAYALDPKDLGVADNVRDRHLTSEEIKALWQVLDSHKRLSQQVRIGLKILLLTGVRTNELLSAAWDEIDFDNHIWNIPEEHSKTNGWTVPLVPVVEDLLLELQDIADESSFVMASGVKDNKSANKSVRISDKAMARCLRRLFEPRKDGTVLLDFPKCTPHDLRRTLRTHLDDLKAVDTETGKLYSIEPHIAEKCLNHSLGRIERTYNKNTLLAKRREALQAWADWIDLVVTDRENVQRLGAIQ